MLNQAVEYQLNLFSWQTEQLATGWRYLANFDFNEAEKTFGAVQQQHKDDEEAKFALKLCMEWKTNFEECCKTDNSKQASYLFSVWDSVMFPQSWGTQLLKKSVLQKIIDIAKANNIFQINNNVNIADLYLKDEKYELAEMELIKHFSANEKTAHLQICLANIQWTLGKTQDAAKTYLNVLITSPDEIYADKIWNKTLSKIVDKYGSEMAPAWGWIHRELPLLEFPNFDEPEKINKKGVFIYYLLFMAEKLAKQNNFKQIIAIRKTLKENDPELYDFYFDLLKRRKI